MTLAAKLAKVMAKIRTLNEDSKHERQGWKFASVNAMYNAVRPLLAEQGVVILPHFVGYAETDLAKGVSGIAHWEMQITDGETEYKVPWVSKANDYDDKGPNKAATSAMKYFVKTMLMISTSEDDPDAVEAPPATKAVEKAQPKTLSQQKASDLAAKLNEWNIQQHEEFASEIVRRDIHALTELTTSEAMKVYQEAEKTFKQGEFLSNEKASELHKIAGVAGIKDAYGFAASVLGRPVKSYTELTIAESVEVYDAIKRQQEAVISNG